MITFANSLYPDQTRQKVGADLILNYLTSDGISKKYFEKENFVKISR